MKKICIVASKYYEDIINMLVSGSNDVLNNHKKKIKTNVKKKEIVSPGHIFPIISKDGGVLVRAGHTEASVDISKLAKKKSFCSYM